ncbi:hypothetical protein ASPWEDRAFT_173157 [Aspergillus wentii DTO 134E9]|uniref:Mitochondrial thiamine pyrophosphate carrier 1 n=1 Tax=Aspergillus wentii DTO 134E9 TaxID=1073089 RepID=A0A1L9RFN3_ASPWE|nr:uncharacterized protein ASPWEDRAFT_173157 [Aspergillus wentii DTO 134E9]OJJ33720.1 hypothetical protein ASPWEDRAFT_173157 [Aspergillus wentii DTO 134E9]
MSFEPELEPSPAPLIPTWKDNLKDLTAGAAGGVAQVFIGQPFDLVKVRLQTQRGGNAISTTRHIWRTEGALAFYKGSLVPILGIGACVSVNFGAFHYFRQTLEAHQNKTTLSTPQFYLAGGMAGIVTSLISTPVEHIRIRLQTQPHGHAKVYTGPLDCVRQLMRQNGIKGIYRGQCITLLREIHGYGVWFATYEALLGYTMEKQNKKREELPNWQIAVCGGIAGEALWLLSHPIDVIKSKMQFYGSEAQYSSARDAMRQTWSAGVKGLFDGIGPALLRAMPVSAGTFATVEVVRKWLA